MNDNDAHKVIYLNAWSWVSEMVWEGLVYVDLEFVVGLSLRVGAEISKVHAKSSFFLSVCRSVF